MATNPYVNKVQYGNSTVMDITDTTASEGDVANGEVFYKKSGERATGTAMVAEIPLLPAHGGTGNTNGRVQVGQRSGNQIGQYATAEGYNNNASGQYAHAEGDSTVASSQGSHAEGSSTTASGTNAHAEGSSTTSSSTCTHAEGMGTTASNHYAHAEGANNTASGISSHAEGQNNTASGAYSHAGGYHTTAGYSQQTAIGTYNDNKSTTLFEVGNGTSNSASNAFEVYSDGHVNAQGEYYQGGVNKSAIWDNAQAGALDAIESTVGWLGKNELPLTLDLLKTLNTSGTWSGNVYSYQGIAYTVSVDGYGYITEIDVHGTATAESVLKLFVGTCAEMYRYNGQILSGVVGAAASTYRQFIYLGESPYTYYASQRDEEVVISNIPNTASPIQYRFTVDSGINVSHAKFKPMIRNASITDSTFEPYHESVKQTLRDAEVIEGKNLIGELELNGFDNNGLNADNAARIRTVGYIPCEKGKSYTISGLPTVSGKTVRVAVSIYSTNDYVTPRISGINWANTPTTFTVTDATAKYMRATFSYTDDTNTGVSSFKDIQLEEGTTATAYEPYYIPLKDAKFDRSEQRVLGAKNLLKYPYYYSEAVREINGITYTVNADGSIKMNGTASARSLFYLQQKLVVPIGRYTFTKGATQSGDFGVVIEGYNNGTWAKNIASSYSTDAQTFDVDYNGYTELRFTLAVENGKSVSNKTIYPMLRLASDTDGTYAPHAMTNKELTDSKDTWTGTSTVDSSGNVVFDNLNDDYAYDLYADDVLITYSGMTKGTGTSSGIKLTYATDAPNGTVCKLRILK